MVENAPLNKKFLDKHQDRYLSKKKQEIRARQEKQKLIDELDRAAIKEKIAAERREEEKRKTAERKKLEEKRKEEEEEYEKNLLYNAYSGAGSYAPHYYWQYERRFAPEAIKAYKLLGKIVVGGLIVFIMLLSSIF